LIAGSSLVAIPDRKTPCAVNMDNERKLLSELNEACFRRRITLDCKNKDITLEQLQLLKEELEPTCRQALKSKASIMTDIDEIGSRQ